MDDPRVLPRNEESYRENDAMPYEYPDDDLSDRRSCWKAGKKVAIILLIPITVAAFAISLAAVIHLKSTDGFSQDSLLDQISVASYFPSLTTTEDGLAVRLATKDCDGEYCNEDLHCDEAGALRTFQESNGNLLCVCDGYSWQCDSTGKSCKTNPVLPSNAQLLPEKSCVNTPSTMTCPFTCSGSIVPSGEFTCTNGEWDAQYCACSASDLGSVIDEADIFGVINTESCNLTKSGDECVTWDCEGDLRRVHLAEPRCGRNGWEFSGGALCGCQSTLLFTTLSMNGIDFVDVSNCDNTPAGAECDQRYWFCPPKLHQQGQFECNKKDGSWHVPEHPCVCSDQYATHDIHGFERSCGYLSVGQSCDYHAWKCDDPLIPITPLECTPDGLKGECGCSLEELESSSPPPSSDADVSGCDKTPVGEICTDWTCGDGLDKLCCNSPVCEEDGSWTVLEDMCGTANVVLDCDVDDLNDYFPECTDDMVPSEGVCQVACNSSANSPFICPNGDPSCSATCRPNGVWDVPCECNPSTLSKKIPFATSTTSCQIGEKCIVSCQTGEFAEPVVCDPWRGYTGSCGCAALGDLIDCTGADTCENFDPWSCEAYEVGSGCTGSEFCFPTLIPIHGNLLCAENSWQTMEGVEITSPEIGDDLCGCNTTTLCDLDTGGIDGCTQISPVVFPVGNTTCPSDDTEGTCGFECDSGVYLGGEIFCDITSGNATCVNSTSSGGCDCCRCIHAICLSGSRGDIVCASSTDCGTQTLFNDTTFPSGCPQDTTYLGSCFRTSISPICGLCTCENYNSQICDGASDGDLICIPSSFCGQFIVNTTCTPPAFAVADCQNETCTLL